MLNNMYLIEPLINSFIIGFFGSRIAVMIYDFMCFGGIFWKIKYTIAKLQGFNVPSLKSDSITSGHERLQKFYDQIAVKSLIIGLLDCKYCMTVWTTFLLSIIIAPSLDFSIIVIPASIIFGYLITEKL